MLAFIQGITSTVIIIIMIIDVASHAVVVASQIMLIIDAAGGRCLLHAAMRGTRCCGGVDWGWSGWPTVIP